MRKEFYIILILAVSMFFFYNGLQTDISQPDEGYYVLMAQSIIKNGGFPSHTIYEQRDAVCPGHYADMNPPVPIYLMTLFYWIGGPIGFKLFGPFSMLLLMLSVFYTVSVIANKRFEKSEYVSNFIGFMAALLVMGIPILVQWSLATYYDIFLSAIFVWFTYFMFQAFDTEGRRPALTAGIVLGLMLLTKQTMVFLIPVLLIYSLIIYFKEKSWKIFRRIAPVIIIGSIMVAPYFIINYINYQNPLFPNSPQIFPASWKYLDKAGYENVFPMQSIAPKHLLMQPRYYISFECNSFGSCNSLSYAVLFIASFALLFYRLDRFNIFLLMIASSIIFIWWFVLPAPDIRYIFPILAISVIPFIDVISWVGDKIQRYLQASLKNSNVNVYFIAIILIVLASISIINVVTALPAWARVNKLNNDDAALYQYLRDNTQKDAVLFDVHVGITAYYTQRNTVFPSPLCGYDMWEFWTKPASEMEQVINRHGINYFVFHLNYMLTEKTKESFQNGTWGVIPITAIPHLLEINGTEIVYDDPNWVYVVKMGSSNESVANQSA